MRHMKRREAAETKKQEEAAAVITGCASRYMARKALHTSAAETERQQPVAANCKGRGLGRVWVVVVAWSHP